MPQKQNRDEGKSPPLFVECAMCQPSIVQRFFHEKHVAYAAA